MSSINFSSGSDIASLSQKKRTENYKLKTNKGL